MRALDWFRKLGYGVIGGPDMPPGIGALRAEYGGLVPESVGPARGSGASTVRLKRSSPPSEANARVLAEVNGEGFGPEAARAAWRLNPCLTAKRSER